MSNSKPIQSTLSKKEKDVLNKQNSTNSRYYYIHACMNYMALARNYQFIVLNQVKHQLKMAERFEITQIFDTNGVLVYDNAYTYKVEKGALVFNDNDEMVQVDSKPMKNQNDRQLLLINYFNHKIARDFPTEDLKEKGTKKSKNPTKVSSERLNKLPCLVNGQFVLKDREYAENVDGLNALHIFKNFFEGIEYGKLKKRDTAIFLGNSVPINYTKKVVCLQQVTLNDYLSLINTSTNTPQGTLSSETNTPSNQITQQPTVTTGESVGTNSINANNTVVIQQTNSATFGVGQTQSVSCGEALQPTQYVFIPQESHLVPMYYDYFTNTIYPINFINSSQMQNEQINNLEPVFFTTTGEASVEQSQNQFESFIQNSN
ncbi:hypothetical protein EIN_372730 [Entamoeba invadens IP1]|uniref:Uncharacterized protein n=1 Tax=Entamoeba invadens IP1 TaxID=370355 RepID=A0A0A1TVR4_ENTIV|nr:hypothetical protein EIN_372730 [Entamoeba invadens IP1]ELP83378.1 hypothetical protein EIN_372730 [Entamoeba invadens IP1]|eukprot:XP_004182724.1 hypothetical protein EIN_372730 [Entamoeba invadens IP1]